MEEIKTLITELQKFDNPKGYKLTHQEVQKELQPVVEKIILFGQESLNELHPLLEDEKTWSCFFALQILQQIKKEESILPLVEFIRRTDNSDYWESGEDAMKALTAIGKPIINALITELKGDFQKKKQYIYLLGALCEIQDKSVCDFMIKILQGYIQDYRKYDGWFDLVPFVLDFDKQEGKEALPLLEKLSRMNHLSEEERREVFDTIEHLKDPKAYEQKMEEDLKLMKEKIPDFEKDMEKIYNPKKGDIDPEEFGEKAGEADENFEANFKCGNCNERQNIKTGLIWHIDRKTYYFEHEIMCKHCHSPEIRLTKEGNRSLVAKQMRILLGKDKGIISAGTKGMVENKKMAHQKAYKYMLQRIKEEPTNAEIYLRAGNITSKRNKYKEAIEFYQKSMQLDPSLISNYINLIQIYTHRADYYGLNEYRQKAEELFGKLIPLFNSHQYNTATIRNEDELPLIVGQLGKELGIAMRRGKIGRNEPCPCGSEIKYKKCCLK